MTCHSPSEISLRQHRVARMAQQRYGIPAAVLVDALAEAERSRARGGLGDLGSILEQRRVVCAGQALELNRLERERARSPQQLERATRALARATRKIQVASTSPAELRDQWRGALDQAWSRIRARVFRDPLIELARGRAGA